MKEEGGRGRKKRTRKRGERRRGNGGRMRKMKMEEEEEERRGSGGGRGGDGGSVPEIDDGRHATTATHRLRLYQNRACNRELKPTIFFCFVFNRSDGTT